jgi:hypothetical protein
MLSGPGALYGFNCFSNMDFERATPVKRNSLNSWMTSPRTYKKANKQISSYWTLLRLLTKSTIAYSWTWGLNIWRMQLTLAYARGVGIWHRLFSFCWLLWVLCIYQGGTQTAALWYHRKISQVDTKLACKQKTICSNWWIYLWCRQSVWTQDIRVEFHAPFIFPMSQLI